jgi:hypothetical protein
MERGERRSGGNPLAGIEVVSGQRSRIAVKTQRNRTSIPARYVYSTGSSSPLYKFNEITKQFIPLISTH